MIYGTGIDIVDVPRIERAIKKWEGRFVRRVFSPAERAYCDSRAVPAMHYAARFAAKESLLKALGTGLGRGIRLCDIDVINDGQGKPDIRLQGSAAEILRRLEIDMVHVSLSHTRLSAVAMVVLEKVS